MPAQTLSRETLEAILGVPDLDQRSRQALMDAADGRTDGEALRAILEEDPALRRHRASGFRFVRAAARPGLLALFPDAAPPRPKAPAPAPAPLPGATARRVPTAAAVDPGLDRLELVLQQLTTRGDDEEATLSLKLHRIEPRGGFEQKTYTGVSVVLRGEEIPAELELEERTLEHAKACGKFGRYQWAVQARIGQEEILNTTRTVTVEPPPGYQPPAPQLPQPAAPNPQAEVRDGLGMFREIVGVVAPLMGKGAAGGLSQSDVEAARRSGYDQGLATGRMEGRVQTMAEWEKKMEDRVEAARREAYERGKTDGRREAEDGFRERERELEAKAGGTEPSMVSEVVSALGGPQSLQALVGAIAGGLLQRKAAAPATSHRAPEPLQAAPRPAPLPPPTVPAPTPAPGGAAAPLPVPAVPVLPEPTRRQHGEIIETLDEALDLLEDAKEAAPDAASALDPQIQLLQGYREAGLEDGPLGEWFRAWREDLGPQVLQLITTLASQLGAEAPPEESDPMPTPDVSALKALLTQRLEEGAAPEAILEELRGSVPPETMREWQRLLKLAPNSAALSFLEIPDRHHGAALEVLKAFQATA